MRAKLINDAGKVKEVKVGFSWTTFFFGFFVPLIRGDVKWFLVMFLGGAALALLTFGIGTLVLDIVMSFIYNKLYVRELIKKGFKPASDADKETLLSKGYLSE